MIKIFYHRFFPHEYFQPLFFSKLCNYIVDLNLKQCLDIAIYNWACFANPLAIKNLIICELSPLTIIIRPCFTAVTRYLCSYNISIVPKHVFSYTANW